MAVSVKQSVAANGPNLSSDLTLTLPAAPTAGNLLVFWMGCDKNSGAVTLAGFTQGIEILGASTSLHCWYKISAGTETTINPSWVTQSVAGNNGWYAELEDVAVGGSNWVVAGSVAATYSDSPVNARSSGTTGTLTNAALAMAGFSVDTSSVVTGARTYTNSYTFAYEGTGLGSDGALFVATKTVASGTTECEFSYVGTGDQIAGAIMAFAKLAAGGVSGTGSMTVTVTMTATGTAGSATNRSGTGAMSVAPGMTATAKHGTSRTGAMTVATTTAASGVADSGAGANIGVITINGINRTDGTDMTTFWCEDQANKLISTAAFDYRDATRVVTLRPRQEVVVTVDGARIFGGQIAQLTPKYDGSATVYTIRCQGFDCLLDQYVIESGVRTGVRTDKDDVTWLTAFIPGVNGLSYVEQIRESDMPDMDYSGMTVRKALDLLQTTIGAALFWMDHYKNVHWIDPRSKQVVKNGDFELAAVNWALVNATTNVDGGPSGVGDESWQTSTSGGSATQQVSGITGNRRYLASAFLYHTVNGLTRVRYQWKNSGGTVVGTDTLTHAAGASTWAQYKGTFTAPATAVSVAVVVDTTGAGTGRADSVTLIGQSAGWAVSDTPDGVLSFAPMSWAEPKDATTPVNRVLIRGNGISGWREHSGSVNYYGQKFEGVLDDERVTTSDGIDSRAAWVFSKYAFPAVSGTYKTMRSGLEAGTFQLVQMAGNTSIQWIATLQTLFWGNGEMLYEVTYGTPTEDISAALTSLQSSTNDSEVQLNRPPAPDLTPDGSPPAVPSALDLTTGLDEGSDGSMHPYLLATWNAVGDVDLDAYELELDSAMLGDTTYSISKTAGGGTLAAGSWRVKVTALGATGESLHSTDPQLLTLVAADKLFVNVTARPGATGYKIYASRHDNPFYSATTVVTGSNVEITAEGINGVAPVVSTAVSFVTPKSFRTANVSLATSDIIGGVFYAARVRAVDLSANRSGWSTIDTVTANRDLTAPTIPTGLAAVPGFKLVGAVWTRSTSTDLARYELRYAPQLGTGGTPNSALWVRVSTLANTAIVSGLVPDVLYFFQVRAVDRSNNVRTSAAVATAVDADANLEAGWSNLTPSWVTATPTLVGAADVAFNTVLTNILAANSISATDIKAGTLSIGGTADTPDFLIVYDTSGVEIGRWDEDGLLIRQTSNPNRQIRIMNGIIDFSVDGGATWSTAITPDGIIADSIKLGTAPGGHNAVPNASFELTAFNTLVSKVWTVTGDWATGLSQVNINTAGTSLTMTTSVY